MASNQDDIKKLWQLYLQDLASAGQVEQLFRFISDPANDEINLGFYRELSGDGAISGEPQDPARARALLDQIIDQDDALKSGLAGNYAEEKGRPGRKRWLRYAAAAAVIVTLAGTVSYLLVKTDDRGDQVTASNDRKANDIVLPGAQKATLTLADGSHILLDSAANGHLAAQGNTQIVKLSNGQLAYNADAASQGALLWNTMSTPRGGQFQLTLPDGTRVWLNAASSITFPAAFAAKERLVKISGEAYFEVVASREKTFRVEIGNGPAVEVLGTSFNVNSYRDEDEVQTTLLQGAVRVIDQKNNLQLKPGQQAIARQGNLNLHNGADLQQVMAWKNGTFNFNNTTIAQAMKQLERWYDIEVKYEGAIPDIRLKGEMDRGVQLADVQRFLSSYGITNKLANRVLTIASK